MDIARLVRELQGDLTSVGYKSSVLPLRRLREANAYLENLRQAGTFNEDFYNERLTRFDPEPPDIFPTAKSLIITAVRQPKVVVKFSLRGKTYPAVIPPTYYYDTDKKALDSLSASLADSGYRAAYAIVPVKTLAVRSGLAAYGKNNIVYVDGWGSYVRLKAFYSDVPCTEDNWQEPRMPDLCEKCVACVKGCPSGAIDPGRFVIRAERCICHLNESADSFPEWVDPKWHNCLMGCMLCQDVCPINKDLVDWTVPGEEFSEEETRMILRGLPESKLPKGIVEKLKSIYMLDDCELLGRNLQALIDSAGVE